MALPKRRHSKTRRDKRRTHWKLILPNFGECPNCHAAKLPHHACLACGYYNGAQVVEIKRKAAKGR